MIQEEYVTWENGKLVGEGLWLRTKSKQGVIICHPHSQMGGTMYNNVVETIRNVFASHAYSTLRFNFRSVGGSTGEYDEGKGEQQDILSACNFMKHQGINEILFSGYSFGAWVGSNVIRESPSLFKGAFMVSPPDKYFKFNWDGLKDAIDLIVCGKIDPFCDINNLKKTAEKINANFEILELADHFYAGYEKKLADCLNRYVK